MLPLPDEDRERMDRLQEWLESDEGKLKVAQAFREGDELAKRIQHEAKHPKASPLFGKGIDASLC